MTDFFENLLNNGELQEKVAELQGKIDAYQMSENEANEMITDLKAENVRLKEIKDDFFKQAEISHQAVQDKNKIIEKLETVMQEIKTIAEHILEKGLEPQSVEHQLRLRGKEELASVILNLITKAESEG